MIQEEIKLIKESTADLKKFGITVGSVLLIIGITLFFFNKGGRFYFTAGGILLIFTAFVYPKILKPLNKYWMILAIILGWFMTRVILSLLFYLVLTPIGLIAKLTGKKFLDLKIDKEKSSYWELRNKGSVDSFEYERQF